MRSLETTRSDFESWQADGRQPSCLKSISRTPACSRPPRLLRRSRPARRPMRALLTAGAQRPRRARSWTRSKGAKLMLIVETIGRIQREHFVLERRNDHSPERAAFGLRRPKGTARTTISCRKSETELSLRHEQSCASAWPRPRAPFPALVTPRKRAEKKIPRFKLRNPLKSLDSDERIQGNPTLMAESSQRNRHEPRKPNRIDRTNVADRRREGAKPTPSKCKAPSAIEATKVSVTQSYGLVRCCLPRVYVCPTATNVTVSGFLLIVNEIRAFAPT
jgi:hypothetical protein